LWGADLSPFALKVEALLRFAGVPFRWLPASGSALESHRFNLRRARLIAGPVRARRHFRVAGFPGCRLTPAPPEGSRPGIVDSCSKLVSQRRFATIAG